jgi:putative DNA primase/helicase
VNIEKIPKELKQRPQWVMWKLESKSDDGKPTKVPYTTNGARAEPNNPKTWTSFQAVLNALQGSSNQYSGLGYMFSQEDPYTGIDLDSDAEKGPFRCIVDWQLTSEAMAIVKNLNSYTEYSQSGNGVHVLIKGVLPAKGRRKGNIEMYDRDRFFVVTGSHLEGTPETIEDRQTQLDKLHKLIFDKKTEKKDFGSREPKSPELSDEDIISIAQQAKNRFKFELLYVAGDIGGYSSNSEADQALCNVLAFYTQDPEQIDRLYRSSGLMRDKWDRDDYREETIRKAIADLTSWYGWPRFDNGDLGNAQRLIHHYGEDLRYCHSYKSWFIWDGIRWKIDSKGEITKIAATICTKIMEEYPEGNDEEWEKALVRQASIAKSKRGIDAMISLAAPFLAAAPEELDADRWSLNVKNGVLDLKTGKLLPHRKELLNTKLAPVEYDAAAECPKWEKFLNDIIEDEIGLPLFDDIGFLQKAFGYSLTGDTSEHVFFMLHGSGRNGKSTLINIIYKLLGDYAEQVNADSLLAKKYDSGGASPDIAKLKGARYVIASESDRGKRLDEAKIKQLTGGDPITCRYLHQNEISYIPQFKIWFSTNHVPNIEGSDKGIWARIRKVDFNRYFSEEERNTRLSEDLEKELPGILRWLVTGCLLWRIEGLKETKTMKKAREEFQLDMDGFSTYVEDNLWIHQEANVKPVELRHDYELWCFENGEYQHNKKVFNDKLADLMRTQGIKLDKNARIDSGKTRVYRGVGLLRNVPANWQDQAKGISKQNAKDSSERAAHGSK